MDKLTLEELLPKANWSVYSLVKMAAIRALELSEGKPSLIKNPVTDKVTSIAFEEIFNGKVMLKKSADNKKGSSKAEAKEKSTEHNEVEV